ncbi:SDR family oxidoreductase [bacterium]|nr:SDR family oxidoreductase [bacterium]
MNIAIIGSNRGIGLALTEHYSKEHQVYAFCRKSSSELVALKAQVIEGCDVCSKEALDQSAQKVKGVEFDLFLHVSGIMRDESYDSLNPETIQEQFMANSIAPLLSVKAFENNLKKGSKVGLLTSRMGSIADNDSGGRYGYRMSKAAVNAGGKSLSIDLKDRGISVFLIHPGFVKTDMTGGQGLLTTQESAQGIAKVMASHGIEATGSFYHSSGEVLPW